ncbi:hypothetical protein [Litoribacillus peritrichatus]|uniref:Uncharacterized protein n=1 Tax=Litoribacillus peritrichatus TaxID=718191 RepID=A0ABP7LV46_9GAMM
MDQQIQESYLSVMGVSQWYPKFVLPNAPELSWPEPEPAMERSPVAIAPGSDSMGSPPATSVAAPLDQLRSLMGAEDASPPTITETAEVKLTSHGSESKSKELVAPFSFLYIRYPLGVSVCVLRQTDDPLSSMEQRFLDAVVKYIGASASIEFLHKVDWPIVKAATEFQSRPFFEESMKAFFQKQGYDLGVNTFFLLGKRLSTELPSILDASSNVITSDELHELMMSASAKRELWKHLLVLKNGQ